MQLIFFGHASIQSAYFLTLT